MSRIVDTWTAGTRHKVVYRVVELDDGIRHLEEKGVYDDDFHIPKSGRATTLALRIMNELHKYENVVRIEDRDKQEKAG